MKPKLYVLVRSDLSRAHQAVQAGHAVAGWCLERSFRLHWDGREIQRIPLWENGTLVYLKVRNEEELLRYAELLPEGYVFREPYWEHSATALAVLGVEGVKEKFESLNLL